MYRSVPSRAERSAAICAQLLLLATLLLALCGLAAVILGVPLPAWQHAAILADTLGVGVFAAVRALFAPRPARRYGGQA